MSLRTLYHSLVSPQNRVDRNLAYALVFLLIWLLGGFFILMICAFKLHLHDSSREGWAEALSLFCHEALLSLAFGAVGSIVGFLFGIPRSSNGLANDSPKDTTDKDSLDPAGLAQRHGEKTNLEQVSDWLTKVILGAGLTQLVNVPTELKRLGEFLAPGFHGESVLPILIALNSAVFGFFTGYVLTQLFLLTAIKAAGQESEAGNSSSNPSAPSST